MNLELAGKRVLVTGASQGIGKVVARAFAAEGCDLQLAARSADRLQQVKDEIASEFPVSVAIHALDLAEPGATDRLAGAAGDIDILVNNAGAIPSGNIFSVDDAEWRKGWDLKVFGYINLTRAVYPRMKAQGGGVIVNNIGVAGELFDADYIAGSSGNAGLMGFTRALGGRSPADNIRVVGVNTGPVESERFHAMLKRRAKAAFGDESRYLDSLAAYPFGRLAQAEEIADLILFLASPRSGYMSGTIVTVDGGLTSRRSLAQAT